MKSLIAACGALLFSASAFAGEHLVWKGHVHVAQANAWISSGWQPLSQVAGPVEKIVFRVSGSYCNLHVADPIQYLPDNLGPVYGTYFDRSGGGYPIPGGKVSDISFNFFQSGYQNINCSIFIYAVTKDEETPAFNYLEADRQTHLVVLTADSLGRKMDAYDQQYADVKDLLKAFEDQAQLLRDQISYRSPLADLKTAFATVEASYEAFSDQFLPAHADVKADFIEMRTEYRALKAIFAN